MKGRRRRPGAGSETEVLTRHECEVLAEHFWREAQVTLSNNRADLFSRLRKTFLALSEGASTVVLTTDIDGV